jgi:soluble cytochrome b562
VIDETAAAAPSSGSPRRVILIVAAVVVVVVIVVSVVGYGVVGYAFASSRIAGAKSAYNTVVSHQNAITEEFNNLDKKMTALSLSTATSNDLQQNRASYVLLVSQSQSAEPTLTTDDAFLARAQANLNQNSWLTLIRRADLDQASAKIGHERKALADAKAIAGDLVQLGTFYQAFYDSLIDLDTLTTKATASDFTGAAAAIGTLKSDINSALQLSDAPGLPPEMKLFLTDFQTLATDVGKLLNAVIAGDINGVQADVKAVDADNTKIESYDFNKITAATKAFYQPMIDAFNAEASIANSM